MDMRVHTIEEDPLDPRALRAALGCFPTGVAIATTCGENGAPVGLTINSFNSVSMDPPLVLWSLARNAASFEAFCRHGAFAVNILGTSQEAVCNQFARPSEDKFAGINWRPGHRGVPVLNDVLVTLECDTYSTVKGGDHEIFIGRVQRIRHTEREPLVFHRGQLVALAS